MNVLLQDAVSAQADLRWWNPAVSSGPTGTRVAAVLSHAGVRQFVSWANHHFGVLPGDRHSGHSASHSDLAIYDVLGALAAGATLHPVPAALGAVPDALARFIQD